MIMTTKITTTKIIVPNVDKSLLELDEDEVGNLEGKTDGEEEVALLFMATRHKAQVKLSK